MSLTGNAPPTVLIPFVAFLVAMPLIAFVSGRLRRTFGGVALLAVPGRRWSDCDVCHTPAMIAAARVAHDVTEGEKA